MYESFTGWRIQNAMSPTFQLSELNRQFGLQYTTKDGIVHFSCGTGPVADELRDKSFVIGGNWDEFRSGKILENEVKPNEPKLLERVTPARRI